MAFKARPPSFREREEVATGLSRKMIGECLACGSLPKILTVEEILGAGREVTACVEGYLINLFDNHLVVNVDAKLRKLGPYVTNTYVAFITLALNEFRA